MTTPLAVATSTRATPSHVYFFRIETPRHAVIRRVRMLAVVAGSHSLAVCVGLAIAAQVGAR